MRILTWLVILILLLFGISFAILNANVVTIHFYFINTALPLSFITLGALIIGVLLGLFVGGIMLLKAKVVQRRLRKKLAQNEKELNNLRNIPLQNGSR